MSEGAAATLSSAMVKVIEKRAVAQVALSPPAAVAIASEHHFYKNKCRLYELDRAELTRRAEAAEDPARRDRSEEIAELHARIASLIAETEERHQALAAAQADLAGRLVDAELRCQQLDAELVARDGQTAGLLAEIDRQRDQQAQFDVHTAQAGDRHQALVAVQDGLMTRLVDAELRCQQLDAELVAKGGEAAGLLAEIDRQRDQQARVDRMMAHVPFRIAKFIWKWTGRSKRRVQRMLGLRQ